MGAACQTPGVRVLRWESPLSGGGPCGEAHDSETFPLPSSVSTRARSPRARKPRGDAPSRASGVSELGVVGGEGGKRTRQGHFGRFSGFGMSPAPLGARGSTHRFISPREQPSGISSSPVARNRDRAVASPVQRHTAPLSAARGLTLRYASCRCVS